MSDILEDDYRYDMGYIADKIGLEKILYEYDCE